MTNIKIINHGDYYDPSIGESFASLSDLVAYFFQVWILFFYISENEISQNSWTLSTVNIIIVIYNYFHYKFD